MKHRVGVREMHRSWVEVELPEDATREEILAAANNHIEEHGTPETEYVYTLDPKEWDCSVKSKFCSK